MKNISIFLLLFLISSCIPTPEEPHSLPLPYEEAEKLVQDFRQYEKIKSMDDASRCHKSINDLPIRLTSELKNQNCDGEYYELVLNTLEIDKNKYNEFRKRLNKTKLRDYTRDGCFDIFTVDGFVNDEWGFIRIECDTIPLVPFRISSHEISFIEPIKGKWYRYGGH